MHCFICLECSSPQSCNSWLPCIHQVSVQMSPHERMSLILLNPTKQPLCHSLPSYPALDFLIELTSNIIYTLFYCLLSLLMCKFHPYSVLFSMVSLEPDTDLWYHIAGTQKGFWIKQVTSSDISNCLVTSCTLKVLEMIFGCILKVGLIYSLVVLTTYMEQNC